MTETSSFALQPSNSATKRKAEPISINKKLRSKIPRRRRFQISPIRSGSSNSLLFDENVPELSTFQADSSSSSCFPGEISSLSTWISAGSESKNTKPRSVHQKSEVEEAREFGVAFRPELRPITRLYLKQIETEREETMKGLDDVGIELSESSCVESCTRAPVDVPLKSGEFTDNNLKSKEQIEVTGASEAVSLSNVCCVKQRHDQIVHKQGEFTEKTSKLVVSDSTADRENDASTIVNRAPELSFSEMSRNVKDSNYLECTSFGFSVDQIPKDYEEHDLTCSENLSFGESSQNSLYEFEPELFPKSSSLEFSDYSSSMFMDSLENSSQESDINSLPPLYFPFFLQFQKQFTQFNSSLSTDSSVKVQDEFYDEFTLLRFENEEYEESYMKFRSRERKLVLHDYAEEYCSTTEFREVVMQQRLLMVNWIVEQSNTLELQSETMFLGVSLMDRFLSQGYFKQKKKLQILGIACLALATRLEENQPYNCVRQSTYYVGKNMYNRAEVIGMEWLVQEVLKFQCFLPTIYNFLWFYLKAAKANAEVEKRTKYLAMLSLLDHERLCYWPSTVAAGLVILASLAANQESSCQWVMETHVRTKNDDLPECIQSLEWLVKYVC